jgi:hypothetical protein
MDFIFYIVIKKIYCNQLISVIFSGVIESALQINVRD